MSLIDELLEKSDKKIVKSFTPKSSLCNKIFDLKNVPSLKEEIRIKLLEITNEFLNYLGIDFFIYDIQLTGSLANYNWSSYSDLDIHIIVDLDEFSNGKENTTTYNDIVKEFFELKKKLWSSTNDIKVKGHDVELYVQDIDDKGVSTGVYSILNNEWVIKPEKNNSFIDEKKILHKSEEYVKLINDLIGRAKKGEDVIKEINDLKEKIKKFRQSGLERGGEYSYENLTFKLLRRNGYIEKLFKAKTTITSKKLSLPQ
jgi:hypothetical protein